MSEEADRWRRLLREHGAALILFAKQWSATVADAEDAMQSGFLRFWKTHGRARDELAYLYACVRSAAMDLGRSERRRESRQIRAVRSERPAFEFSADRAERQSAIESALGQLPGDQREVVVMKIWGGLTFGQIGEALGVPLNTAASRYRYALSRLHAELSTEVAND